MFLHVSGAVYYRFDVSHCDATQVRSSPGHNDQHYFYKFCLCPRGTEPALRKPDGWKVRLRRGVEGQ